MNLRYTYAVISFCPDLTRVSEPSWPVAVLLAGEADHVRVAVATGLQPSRLVLDRITMEVLADIPHLLKRQMQQAIEKLGADADLEQLIRRIHDLLRNSLHVSRIVPIQTQRVDEVDEASIPMHFMRIATDCLQAELASHPIPDGVWRQAGDLEKGSKKSGGAGSRPASRALPSTSVWPLEPAPELVEA